MKFSIRTALFATAIVAVLLYWKSLGRQVRVRGPIEKEDGPIADAYYASRPLDSRLGAWASEQSRPLASREHLMEAVEKARETHGDAPRRPAHWGGYRIRPLAFEFWANGDFRLHDRFAWNRADFASPWQIQRLNP